MVINTWWRVDATMREHDFTLVSNDKSFQWTAIVRWKARIHGFGQDHFESTFSTAATETRVIFEKTKLKA